MKGDDKKQEGGQNVLILLSYPPTSAFILNIPYIIQDMQLVKTIQANLVADS